LQILLKFWPFLVLTLVILIWFIGSRKNKELKITNMKIWVLTISTVIVLFLIFMIYEFSTSTNPPSDYKRIESYDTEVSTEITDPDEKAKEAVKFNADNVPKEIP